MSERWPLQPVSRDRIPGYNLHLGMDDIRAGGGRAEIRATVRDEFTNRRGASHGGFITSMLDSALGTAVVSALAPEEWCGTVQLNVQFLAPARGALLARGEMVRRGRNLAFARGSIVDERGHEVATAEGTWYVWPFHPDRGEG